MPCFNDHLQPLPVAVHSQPAESIPECLAALAGIATAKPGDPRLTQSDALAYSTMVARTRLQHRDACFSNPLSDWLSWDVEVRDKHGTPTGKRRPRERDRKASALTKPEAIHDNVSYATVTTRVKLAHAIRKAGLFGYVNLPSRKYTANAKPTPNVPDHLSALPPSDIGDALADAIPQFMLLNDAELRHLRKYRYAMKGEKFAESMATEARERELAYEREAFPYLPRNKAGNVLAYYSTPSGTIFSDGTTLAERIQSWKAHNAEHVDDMQARSKRLADKAELAALIEAQSGEREHDKRHSRKVRERNVAVTALRF